MSNIIWFDDLKENHLEIAGGKGASLCRMIQKGVEVPEGFIVTTSMYQEFMESNSLFDIIYEKLETIDFSDENKGKINEIGKEIQGLIKDSEISDDLRENIINNYNKFKSDDGSCPVAVRSSSTAEDLDDASFAGQQETFLYVMGENDLIDKIKACFASLYTGRAIFYRNQNEFDEKDVSIAVVVQRMVNSEKSGVMFTANPITNIEEQTVIEATWGLGEGVVSGIVTPDNYIVGKSDYEMVNEYVSEKEVMVVRKDSGIGVEEVEVPDDKKEEKVLNKGEIKCLVDYASKLEKLMDGYQDVEWAIEGNDVYILQSRPITTISKEG